MKMKAGGGTDCYYCDMAAWYGEFICPQWRQHIYGETYEDSIVKMVDDEEKKEGLIAFEKRVADAFENKQIKGPVHLSGGNEDHLLEIFKDIHPEDWIVTFYRNHYHALLHGVPEEKLFQAICDGHSMTLQFPEHRFFSTAIVGGQLSIAVGIAAALKRKDCKRRVWCFLGDMASQIGTFWDAYAYADGWNLPVEFIVEDNGLSCNSPTKECFGGELAWIRGMKHRSYRYTRTYPHVGIDKWVQF